MSSSICSLSFLLVIVIVLISPLTVKVNASSSIIDTAQPHFVRRAVGAALAISSNTYTTTQFVVVNYGGGFGYARDWFGIYLTTQTPGLLTVPGQTTTRWAYASGTMTPPAVGLTNGTIFLGPVNTAGNYFVGWFINDTYVSYTPFAFFNVTDPALTPSSSSSASASASASSSSSSSSSTGSSSSQFNSSSSSISSINSTTSNVPALQTNALLNSSQSMLSQWWMFIVFGVAGITFVLLVLGAMLCVRKRFAAYKVAKAAEKELMVRSLDGVQTMARKSMS